MEPVKGSTALLVMDMQAAIVRNQSEAMAAAVTAAAAKAIAHARSLTMPVIYVVVGFRPGAPEISVQNKSFSANRQRFVNADTEEWTTIHRAVAPMPGEIVVTKRRISAFTGSDLEVVLRAHDIRHIVLTGVSTSGVVLSTVREAADKDFRITVLADGCADADAEVHRVLTTKVFPRQADVLTVDEWVNRQSAENL